MDTFLEFVDKKQREAKKHLALIEKLLRSSGFQVSGHLKEADPYVFVKAQNVKLSFEGVRVYQIGDTIAFRVQKQEKTEPYGKAYMLDLEEMYNDLMSDDLKEMEAGKKVIENVAEEIKDFFQKSASAEDEQRQSTMNGDLGQIQIKTGGTDYSSLVYSKT